MTTETIAPGRNAATEVLDRFRRLQQRYPLIQIVVFAAAFAYGAVAMDGFVSWSSIRSMLVLAALVGIAALGQTLVVILGGFDLSVSGFIVFSALVITQFVAQSGVPFGVGVVVALVGTAVLGAISGWLCHRFQANPIIVTLAMGTLAVGLIQAQTGGAVTGTAPAWLSSLSAPIATTFGLPIPPVILIWIVLAIGMWLVLTRTAAGRRLYATGANPHAADLALVRTRRVWVAVFAFSGLAAAFAGIMLTGFVGSVTTSLGDPYLFQSLAAVIVGGTAFGGPGDYWRTVGGAILLVVLTTVLTGIGLRGADQSIVYGVIILLAMVLYGRQRRLRDQV
jgi:ribose transport system permease protein